MRWTKLACVALLTAMVGLASVGLTPGARAQSRNEILLVVTESGPNSMDIHGVGANRPSYQASWNLYDRLLTYGVKTLADGSKMYDYSVLKPELAESWQVAPDGMSVTLKLRRDAKFHDGTPVTARDVKWSFDRAVTVGGFPTFQMKAGSLEKPEQFVVVDDGTFKINFLRKDRLTLPDIAVPMGGASSSTAPAPSIRRRRHGPSPPRTGPTSPRPRRSSPRRAWRTASRPRCPSTRASPR